MFRPAFYLLLPLFFLISCAKPETERVSSTKIKYIDKVVIDEELMNGTVMGGLSSIDYISNNRYVVISDDRSEYSPARIYEMDIEFNQDGIEKHHFVNHHFLKNRDNNQFEENELDPESIRYRASTDTYFYTSEGGRTKEWVNPFVREMNREGKFLSEINIPEMFYFHDNKGLRENGGFESLTFENDTIIWYANELPLKEDGEVPGFTKAKNPVRLVRQDIKNDQVLGQYAYNIDPLREKANPKDAFYINSVPEILFIEENKLWIMERSYITGVGNFVRVFEVKIGKATDVKEINSLSEAKYSPVSKKLILDFSDFDDKLDNIEGLTFGPDFQDGSKSLLFISDDNFNESQETQLWLFSVTGLE